MENQSLVADLVSWIKAKPRTYPEVMDAWKTSCPRLSIWEDTVQMGLVKRELGDGGTSIVTVTKKGEAFLQTLNDNPPA
ncbi:MAG: hypothetical protein AAF468_18860 [Pseudomonadota bacterium]